MVNLWRPWLWKTCSPGLMYRVWRESQVNGGVTAFRCSPRGSESSDTAAQKDREQRVIAHLYLTACDRMGEQAQRNSCLLLPQMDSFSARTLFPPSSAHRELFHLSLLKLCLHIGPRRRMGVCVCLSLSLFESKGD